MHVFAVAIIFGGVIAEQPQIKKVGVEGKKLEGGQFPFVERAGVGQTQQTRCSQGGE